MGDSLLKISKAATKLASNVLPGFNETQILLSTHRTLESFIELMKDALNQFINDYLLNMEPVLVPVPVPPNKE